MCRSVLNETNGVSGPKSKREKLGIKTKRKEKNEYEHAC